MTDSTGAGTNCSISCSFSAKNARAQSLNQHIKAHKIGQTAQNRGQKKKKKKKRVGHSNKREKLTYARSRSAMACSRYCPMAEAGMGVDRLVSWVLSGDALSPSILSGGVREVGSACDR